MFHRRHKFIANFFGLITLLSACSGAQPENPLPIPEVSEPTRDAGVEAEKSLELAGACIDPDEFMKTKEEAEHGLRRFDEAFDLDGDGDSDVALGVESLCGVRFGNCEWSLFVMRGDCGHFVGVISGYMGFEAEKENGLFNVYSTWSMGCGGHASIEKIWSFDGSEYRVLKSRECHCPEHEILSEADAENLCDPW